METLISQFTFLLDQAFQDKNFDPFTTEDPMKLFEIESYNAWVAVELEQKKEVEEAEVNMLQQADDHFGWVMQSAMEEFRYLEEDFERMSKAGHGVANSLFETAESGGKMGSVVENAASVASKRCIEAAVNSAFASSKDHPS